METERHTLAYRRPDTPARRHSPIGMVALALAVAVGGAVAGMRVAISTSDGKFLAGPYGAALAFLAALVLLAAWVAAIVLGLSGLFDPAARRTLPALALVVCVADAMLPFLTDRLLALL
jgi:heme A synthase